MIDAIIKFLDHFFEQLSGSWQVLGALWLLWAAYVLYSLYYDGKDRQRLLGWMRGDLGLVYRRTLESALDYTAQRWFGDYNYLQAQRLSTAKTNSWIDRLFGSNAFTALSYDFNLRMALFYPLFSMLLVWVFSGRGGVIGELVVLENQDSLAIRVIAALSLILAVFFVFKSYHTKGWKRGVYSVLAGAGRAIA